MHTCVRAHTHTHTHTHIHVYIHIDTHTETTIHTHMYISNTHAHGGARGVQVTIIENGHGDSSSNPRQGISHSANTLGKGINPVILPTALSK